MKACFNHTFDVVKYETGEFWMKTVKMVLTFDKEALALKERDRKSLRLEKVEKAFQIFCLPFFPKFGLDMRFTVSPVHYLPNQTKSVQIFEPCVFF